jgi:galactokinase
MSGAAFAAALVERGLDSGELSPKRSLFGLVLDAFRDLAGDGPPHVWWVPGRLEVFGKHTDYAGGRTLVCAVPRGLAVAARPRREAVVHVVDARRREGTTLPLAAGRETSGAQPDGGLDTALDELTGWRRYVGVVTRRLARNFPGAPLGADVVFASDLPRASGMSSSSALLIGLAAALTRVAGIEGRAEWQANIRDGLDAAGYYACIENGLTFGTLTGDSGVGTHGGSEDHAAILCAEPGHLSAFAFVPLRHIGKVPVPGSWRFVLVASGVAAEKTGSVQAPYNRLSRGAGVLLELWNAAQPHARSLAAALDSSTDAPDRMRELVLRSTIEGWPAAALEKRLAHFIREDARASAACDAFRSADAPELARIAEDSQGDAETLLENQVTETVSLARSARALGAFAACSFGAGFGGSVWALVDGADAVRFAARWHPDAFVASPGPALVEL